MKVDRVITFFEKHGDKFIDEVSIDNITIADLEKIIGIFEDDPNLYKVYKLSKDQYLLFLEKLPDKLSEFNFDNYDVFCECYNQNG